MAHKGRIARQLEAITDFDNPDGEGWAIFDAQGSSANENGDCPFQLQKFDELEKFESDPKAHAHVLERAVAGSKPHMLALRYLRRFSHPEFVYVVAGHQMLRSAA